MSAAVLEKPSFNIVKERNSYTIVRDGKPYLVIVGRDGDTFRVRPHIRGAATASTPQSAASSAAQTLRSYLQVAAQKPYSITGTIASGLAGGSLSQVNWQQNIPIIPAFCVYIDYEVQLAVTLTLPAGKAATVSPFAPFCAFQNQITLGGAPPWPLMELTPWHIDETLHRNDYDPSYFGLGVALNTAVPGYLDQGPIAYNVWSGNSVPGTTITNSGTSSANYNISWNFTLRQVLQVKRHLLWGAVPFGDPENRPNNILQLNTLVGVNPEQNLFVNNTGASTAVTNGTQNINAVYKLSYIDLLPPSMQQAPTPAVTYGRQLVPSSPQGLAQNALYPMTHRTAMVYTSMHHLLINGQLPIEANYFGLWDDQDQQSSRYSYDSQVNTFQEYFTEYHRTYRRFPNLGVYTNELDDGVFPEVPSVTPYVGLMTPDQSYASAFNLPVTPAMTTTLRMSAATSTPYVRLYEFGLVRVPY